MADKALAGALDFLQEIESGHDEHFGELSRGLTNQLFALMRIGADEAEKGGSAMLAAAGL